MRSGADSEMTSGLGGPEIDIIKQAPGITRDGQTAVASARALRHPRRAEEIDRHATRTCRCAASSRPSAGPRRRPRSSRAGCSQFGTNEVIVGRGANGQFAGLNVGDELRSGQVVVEGRRHLRAGRRRRRRPRSGATRRSLQGAYRRGNSYQSVLARLERAGSFDAFKDWLTTNPQLNVNVRRETDYYASQSRLMTQLIERHRLRHRGPDGIGAVFGAILTMYTAVATRTREIATLRALGLQPHLGRSSRCSAKSLALARSAASWAAPWRTSAFNGYQTSTMNFQTFSQVAFAFRVTPTLLMTGLIYALAIGFIGGLFPAIRAARLPIPSALREL